MFPAPERPEIRDVPALSTDVQSEPAKGQHRSQQLSARHLAPLHAAGRSRCKPAGLKWLGLEVRRHEQQDADHASVEFVARSKLGGRAQRLHETSRFAREDGRWFYLDGDPG